MRRWTLALCCVAAVAATGAGAFSGVTVRADGEIGSFTLDQTTEKQVRALAGKPLRVEMVRPLFGGKARGRTLVYRCGPGCETAYSISRHTGKLSDFSSNSPRFVTEHGSYVGLRGAKAARFEGNKAGPGCGKGRFVRIRWDADHRFVLQVQHGIVIAIAYLGPNSVFPDGFC